MGKYDSLLKGSDNARALTESNIYIANELTELNRLNKVKIRIMLNDSSMSMDLRKNFLSELEDRA